MGQFRCSSGQCIADWKRCNVRTDCIDKSDEVNCTKCAAPAFTCDSGGCINPKMVCNFYPDCLDHSDENAHHCPNGTAPLILTEFWHWGGWHPNASLAFVDENVAVYFSGLESSSQITWPFVELSQAWKYIKNTYSHDSLGSNPRLYVVLHDSDWDRSETYSHSSSTAGFRNLVDVGHSKRNGWTENTFRNFERLFSSLAWVLYNRDKQENNGADYGVCRLKILDIIRYDIYLHFKGQSAELDEWTWKINNETEQTRITLDLYARGNEVTWKYVHCFRDWYLPIYKKYGGPAVLKKFFKITKLHWHPNNQAPDWNQYVGKFVHFWSEAAGEDLQPLAVKAINWSEPYERELVGARAQISFFNYTRSKDYTVINETENVGFYFSAFKWLPASFYGANFKTWKYVQDTFGPFSNKARARIVLTNQTGPYDTQCTSWSEHLPDPDRDLMSNETFLQIIYCLQPPSLPMDLTDEFHSLMEQILEGMAFQILELVLGTTDWPARNVSGFAFATILTYDIYTKQDKNEYVIPLDQWLGKEMEKKQSFPPGQIAWFWDWHLKIYQNHGGAMVLRSFIHLLKDQWFPDNLAMSSKQLNMGELLHFWCGAAGTDLRDLATASGGWNETHNLEFAKARIRFPNFNYTCDDCDEWTEIPRDLSAATKQNWVTTAVGIAATLFISFLVFGCILGLYRRRVTRKRRAFMLREIDEFFNGHINATPTDVFASIQSAPFNKSFEIPAERISIDFDRVLGAGEFGSVLYGVLTKGDAESECERDATLEVAVKTVKSTDPDSCFKSLLSEIKILGILGPHENIASLLATVTENIQNREVFAALEFCHKGDLLRYLRGHKGSFQDLRSSPQDATPAAASVAFRHGSDPGVNILMEPASQPNERLSFSTHNLVEWSRQIASGMDFITSKNIIHGDLAARNILLAADNTIKISDFGLSRQLANFSIYKKKSGTTVRWKWLALESLCEQKFSVYSDIWSYGVTLWELFNLGREPYPGQSWDHNFIKNLVAGCRLESPDFAPPQVYSIMMICWTKQPTERKLFDEIISQLESVFPQHAEPTKDCVYASL